MAFLDIRFPETISYRALGGPQFQTSVARVRSGRETRNQIWQYPLHIFNVAHGAKVLSDLDDVIDFFYVAAGRFSAWRYKDWRDYKSTDGMIDTVIGDDQDIGVGDALETDFQLIKTYTVGSVNFSRKITRPVSGTVKVYLDGVEQVSGFTVDHDTGIVSFSVAPGATVRVSAGYEFDIPARFSEDLMQQSIEACDAGQISSIMIEEIRE